MNGITPVQRCMLSLLSDGLPHSPDEIKTCLGDSLADITHVRLQISRIRKHIRPLGEEIVCEIFNRKVHYRHVRLLSPQPTEEHIT